MVCRGDERRRERDARRMAAEALGDGESARGPGHGEAEDGAPPEYEWGERERHGRQCGEGIERPPRGRRIGADEVAAMAAHVCDLAEMRCEDRPAVMKDDHVRRVLDGPAGLRELQTQNRVFPPVERRAPAANRLERAPPDEEVV